MPCIIRDGRHYHCTITPGPVVPVLTPTIQALQQSVAAATTKRNANSKPNPYVVVNGNVGPAMVHSSPDPPAAQQSTEALTKEASPSVSKANTTEGKTMTSHPSKPTSSGSPDNAALVAETPKNGIAHVSPMGQDDIKSASHSNPIAKKDSASESIPI